MRRVETQIDNNYIRGRTTIPMENKKQTNLEDAHLQGREKHGNVTEKVYPWSYNEIDYAVKELGTEYLQDDGYSVIQECGHLGDNSILAYRTNGIGPKVRIVSLIVRDAPCSDQQIDLQVHGTSVSFETLLIPYHLVEQRCEEFLHYEFTNCDPEKEFGIVRGGMRVKPKPFQTPSGKNVPKKSDKEDTKNKEVKND